MARITDGTFKEWNDTEIVSAAEYTREREILKVATNDNDERLSNLESSTIGLELGTLQTSKITANGGGVKVNVTSTDENIITKLTQEGVGLHTFYAISGSGSLPPSQLSIRGFAHITAVNPVYGYVIATDYNNQTYTGYINNNVWSDWKSVVTYKVGDLADDLDTMRTHGSYYVNPGTENAPVGEAGVLVVTSVERYKTLLAQTFIEYGTGDQYTRTRRTEGWKPWRRLVTASDTQTELWNGGAGLFMQEGQTVTPTKKLTQCRNGWILVWSDYLNSDAGPQNYDFHYTYIPKFIATKHNGAGHLISVPTAPVGTVINKYVNISDTKIEGTSGNEVGDDADAVLRYVLEW